MYLGESVNLRRECEPWGSVYLRGGVYLGENVYLEGV